LVIEASRFRSQDRNREDARTRLCAIILAATVVPKKRVATKPSRAAKERRLTAKKRDAGIKRTRRVRGSDE
jgi:ribosome-associated protein